MDGESWKGDVVVMDRDYVPVRVYIACQELAHFGFAARCPDVCRCAKEPEDKLTPKVAGGGPKRSWEGGGRGEAAEKRTKEFLDRAAAKRSAPEEVEHDLRERA